MPVESILVAGSSRGLGLAIVKRLATSQHHVISWSRTGAVAEVDSGSLERIAWERVDVADVTSVRAAFNSHYSNGRAIDSIIYAAGVLRTGVVGEEGAESFLRMYETNVFGAFNVLTEYVSVYGRHPKRVIGLASEACYYPSPARSGYHSSKAALASFLECYRLEARTTGTLITLIYLGKANTSLSSRSAEQNARALQPDQVATVVCGLIEIPHPVEIRSLEISSVLMPYAGHG